MRIAGLVALLLVIATAGSGYEVPVTSAGYRPSFGQLPGVAGNGHEFLVAWWDFRRGSEDGLLVAARLSSDGGREGLPIHLPTRPRTARTVVTAPLVVWTGGVWVVGWDDRPSAAFHYVRIDGDGRLLDLAPHGVAAVRSVPRGAGALIVYRGDSGVEGLLFDSQEVARRIAIPGTANAESPAVSASNHGFLVAWGTSGVRHPTVVPLSPDGTPGEIVSLSGHGITSTLLLASDGEEFLMVCSTDGATRLDRRGRVMTVTPFVAFVQGVQLVPWQSGFLLVESASRATILDRNGRRTGSRTVADANVESFRPVVLAFSGDAAIAVWADRDDRRIHAHVVDAQSGNTDVSMVPRQQTDVRIASSGDGFLVAFREAAVRQPGPVVVARVSANGEALDGDGIALGIADANPPAVAFDGKNYVVAWAGITEDHYGLRINRIAPDGSLLDGPDGRAVPDEYSRIGFRPHPYRELPAPGIALASNGRETLLVWNEFSTPPSIRAIRIHRDGTFLPPFLQISAEEGDQFAAAWSRGMWLVTWRNLADPGWSNAVDANVFRSTVVAARIDGRWNLLDGTPIQLSPASYSVASSPENVPTIASNGDDFLVVWREQTIRARRVGLSGLTGFDAFSDTIEIAEGRNPSVAARGKDYVVAWDDGDDLHSTIAGSGVRRPLAASAEREQNVRLVSANGTFVAAYERVVSEDPFLGIPRAFVAISARKVRVVR